MKMVAGEKIEIQCLCGAVGVELNGPSKAQFFCHCDDCQAVHGAAYMPYAVFAKDDVNVVRGNPTSWALKGTPRTTCSQCGTRLFSEVSQVGIRSVSGGLLPKGTFQPAFHMQCRFAVRPVRDSLPHFKGFPAPFGGTDETVDW
ncbi:GFA family protein [Labilithrix luteola]|uniref:GFA family protein n=1 Tax=Labilithrix luteola TaxID=1391654 RepID=UPI001969CACD